MLTTILYQEGVRLPAVLPVVLYTGMTPWGAAREFADLVPPTGRTLESYRPSQRYDLLDEHHDAEEDLPEPNLVTAVIRLERIESPWDRVRAVDLLREWLRGPEDQDLRRAFTDCVRRNAQRIIPGGEQLAAEMTLEDMRMSVVERVSEWPKQWMREGRERLLAPDELATRPGPRRFARCRLQPPLDESALGAIHRRCPHSRRGCDRRVAMALLRA